MRAPSLRVAPEGARPGYGKDAAIFAAEHDTTLDDWQAAVLDDWLALDDLGRYAASTCGLSVPRQNGKTCLLKARANYGVCVLGETILYTAHEVKTARKTFEELAADFDPENGYPDLREQVDYIRRANGQEEIKLLDWQDENGDWHPGGRLIFSARSRGAARGFTCDCVFFDEAQELTSEQLAALLPTISASPLGNPQTIMIGTVPDPRGAGDVFKNTRRAAVDGEAPSTSWNEWSAAPDYETQAEAWERIAAANPGYPVRLLRTAIQSELDTMPRDYFARERLGFWPPEVTQKAEAVISAEAWAACETNDPPADGLTVYAVKCRADGRRAAVCVALKPPDGVPHVEYIESADLTHGSARLVDWLAARKDRAAQIVIDGQSAAATIADRLKACGVPLQAVQRPTLGEVVAAYSAFVDAVNAGDVTHYGQAELTNAATLTKRRAIGKNGGFGFDSTEYGDASIIEAAALALRSVNTTKRRPGRKAVIY